VSAAIAGRKSRGAGRFVIRNHAGDRVRHTRDARSGRLCDPDDRGYNVRPEKDEKDEKDVVVKISTGTLRS
jgi:hypothetical protein